jgi:mannan endo-1,4-beta-mannosidase
MFNPYHETNAKDDWWDTRKGIHGSPALYRMLFDRLVNRDGLRNLVWVWEAEPPIAGSASLSDYFPGLLYVDALELSPRFMRRPDLALDRFLTALAPGKPVGIELSGDIPTPDALFARSQWSWFILDAAPDTPARTDALQKLLTDPRISSVP